MENERNTGSAEAGIFVIGERPVDRTGLGVYDEIYDSICNVAAKAFVRVMGSENADCAEQYISELADVTDTWSQTMMLLIMQKLSSLKQDMGKEQPVTG